jgi:hypothetical protein
MNPLEIERCVNNSFESPGNYQSDNKYLKEDRFWQAIMQVNQHPAITINNHTYIGDFNALDITRAICASFKTRPAECTQDAMEALRGSSIDYLADYKFEDKARTSELIFAGVFIIFLNVGMIMIHKSSSKKDRKSEIQMEVNQAVAQYFALRGDEPAHLKN